MASYKQPLTKQTRDEVNTLRANLDQVADKKSAFNTVVDQESSVVVTEVRSQFNNRVNTKPSIDNLRVDLNEVAGKNVQNTVVEQESSFSYS